VRAGVVESGDTPIAHTAQAVKPRMLSVSTSSVSMASFTSLAWIFLPRYSGVRPDHESGDEDGEHDKDEHAVKTCADTADDDFAQLDVEQRNESADGREGVVHRVHRAARGGGGDGGEKRGVEDAEAHFLALHVAIAAAMPSC
jgi:hypothetical protein